MIIISVIDLRRRRFVGDEEEEEDSLYNIIG